MPFTVYFNELSAGAIASKAEGKQCASKMLEVLLELRGIRSDLRLLAHEILLDCEISEGYSFRSWYVDLRNSRRDETRWLLSLLNRSPDLKLPPSKSDPLEYRISDRVAQGLGAHRI